MSIKDKFNLTGRVAIVTGSAGLLGKQHSRALLDQGAVTVLTDLSLETLNKRKNELLEEFPDGVIECQVMDITQEESVRKVFSLIMGRFNQVDILINNAAINPKVSPGENQLEKSRLENFPLSDWNLQLNVGLTGAFICSKIFGTSMAAKKSGVILNISSDLSVFAPDQRIYRKTGLKENQQPVKPITYSVIKTGLIGMTRYLAGYWAQSGVRVNAISPGGVFTNQPDEFVQKLTNLIPLGRMAKEDEYCQAIQFLCSDASSYMTGQNIVIDGGRSIL